MAPIFVDRAFKKGTDGRSEGRALLVAHLFPSFPPATERYRFLAPNQIQWVSNYCDYQGVSISELRWCQNSQKGLEPKNVKIWKSSLPCGGLWKNQVCNCHFHLQCLTSEIFRNFCGTFSRHFLLARNSPGRPGRNDILPGLPENLKFSLKFEILRQARQNIISAWPAWRVSSQ